MKKIVCFGEIMLRLSPEGYYRLLQADRLNVVYGGCESNVACALSGLGLPTAYVTKLPTHEIGQAAVNTLRGFGVDTAGIVRGGSRIGVYYLERGASQRPSKVVYDRAGSAIAAAEPSEFDWDDLLADADWFYFSGITAALSATALQCCRDALAAAKRLGVKVGCDLNYRSKLWTTAEAGAVMRELLHSIDLFIANEEHAGSLFGIYASDEITDDMRRCADVGRQIAEQYGCETVAITLRRTLSASDNRFGAVLWENGAPSYSRIYTMHLVDRVGGGDAFAAGLLYAKQTGMPTAKALEFAVAASCLKHSIEGDVLVATPDEIAALAEGDGTGRTQR